LDSEFYTDVSSDSLCGPEVQHMA